MDLRQDTSGYNDQNDMGRATQAASFLAQRQREGERERAYEESLVEDLGEEWRLPITHRPTENLDRDGLEAASVDTRISSSNIGYKLLMKMGWKGQGLGKSEQGITEPIKAGARDGKLGVGKQEQDEFYTAEENVERKKLNVEVEETEDMAKKRELGLSLKQSKERTGFTLLRLVLWISPPSPP